MSNSYYDTLGVTKNSSHDTIKKAYHKLAMKYHPDKGGDEDKFKKINEAFEVLGDSSKRSQYDSKDSNASFQFSGNDPFDVFKHFFRDDQFSRPFTQQPFKTTKKVSLRISLEDLYHGKKTTLKISRQGCCGRCNGSGGSSPPISCSSCGGCGKIRRVIQIIPGMTQQSIGICPDCNGIGSRIPSSSLCSSCSGSKTCDLIDTLSISIKKGTRSGEQIVLKNKGDYDPHTKSHENLILVIEQKQHHRFKIRDDDLLVELNVPLFNCITSGSFKYIHIDKHEYLLKTDNSVISPESLYKVSDLGMPIHNKTSSFGSLLVKINIIFPPHFVPPDASLFTSLNGSLFSSDLPVKTLLPFHEPSPSNCSQQ